MESAAVQSPKAESPPPMSLDLFDPWLLLAALCLDAVLGEPTRVYRWVPHPVVVCGGVIARVERHANRPERSAIRRRLAGIGLTLALLVGGVWLGMLLEWGLSAAPVPSVMEIAAVAVLLAGRSLHDHVADVATALRRDDAHEARRMVARIVGRDVRCLDTAGVARAAIETLAENASDGVVAPALFYLIFGLPGLLAYKAINTADSMIGHKTLRYRDFGWAAARLDDMLNYIPARATAALLAVAAIDPGWRTRPIRRAFATARREARRHASPNAGWPEAAMAGGLGLRLGGPRAYGAMAMAGAWFGAGRRDATAADIDAALAVYRRALALLAFATLALAVML